MLWESIWNKITRKIIINYFLVCRLEGSRNTKRGFWVCFSKKSKKRGKFYVGWKVWPHYWVAFLLF